MPVYDALKPIFDKMTGMKGDKLDYLADYKHILSFFGASTVSGMVAMGLMYPLDTVKK